VIAKTQIAMFLLCIVLMQIFPGQFWIYASFAFANIVPAIAVGVYTVRRWRREVKTGVLAHRQEDLWTIEKQ